MIVRRGLAASLSVFFVATAAATQGQDGAFDTNVAPDVLATAEPGALLRSQELSEGLKAGTKGFRILYRSTDPAGKPVAVTGAVFYPATDAGSVPRPVVAWAHPTTGVASKCAPTLLPGLVNTVQGLDDMIGRGYVVTATDYIGLGTGGVHPYLSGTGGSHAVIDSVRAAQHLEGARAGARFAAWGHSEGGHAALFTGIQAAAYAPELELVGVAVAAPAVDLVDLFKNHATTQFGRTFRAMLVRSWSQSLGLDWDAIIESGASSEVVAAAEVCFDGSALKPLEAGFMKVRLGDYEPARIILERNTPGALPAGTPVFIVQGEDDDVIPLSETESYIDTLCAGGSRVELKVLAGVDHIYAAYKGAPDAVAWMHRRFSGEKPQSRC